MDPPVPRFGVITFNIQNFRYKKRIKIIIICPGIQPNDIERLFENEKSIFKPRFPGKSEQEISDFESESENNGPFFPIEGPNDFMFNDFEIIGGEVSSEVKEVRSEEYEAIEEIRLPENEKNLNGGFFEEKKRPSKKNSICEKLKSKNPGMFCIFTYGPYNMVYMKYDKTDCRHYE